VKATDIGRLHPAIEATAYYIAAEATANAVKHARAHQVEITLARTPQVLQLTITDDGVGGAAISGGAGLQGLHDRGRGRRPHHTDKTGRRADRSHGPSRSRNHPLAYTGMQATVSARNPHCWVATS